MKKVLLILFILFSFSSASDLKTEQKIYKLIIHTLLPNKQTYKVWSDTKHNRELLATTPHVILVNSPKDADFLLLNNDNNLTNTKAIIFVTDFQLLEKMKNSAVGGFFWQKGRPNILFLRKNLQKYKISLPESMQEFIEEEI